MIKRLFDLLIGRVSVWESEVQIEGGLLCTEYGVWKNYYPWKNYDNPNPDHTHDVYNTRSAAAWDYILRGADWYSGEDDRYLGRS